MTTNTQNKNDYNCVFYLTSHTIYGTMALDGGERLFSPQGKRS